MTYTLKYVTDTSFIRNFTNPPLDYSDVSEAELLAKIEAIEDYVDTVYEIGAKVPCALLVLSKIIQSPKLAQKHYLLNMESIGDYTYRLGNVSESPYASSESLEEMAHKMLRMLSFKKNNKLKVYITNL